jgi:hypothetical protein
MPFGKISLTKIYLTTTQYLNILNASILLGVNVTEFWEGFFYGILFYFLVRILIKSILTAVVLSVAKEEIEKIKKETEEILLRLEKHGDILYCYRKDNDEFVCQGKTIEEIADLFKKKYPNNNAKILKEDFDGAF